MHKKYYMNSYLQIGRRKNNDFYRIFTIGQGVKNALWS